MIKVGALTGVLVALGALGGMGADGCEAMAWPAGMAGITSASAQEKILNLYSARHYDTDEALYADFTRQTGIVGGV